MNDNFFDSFVDSPFSNISTSGNVEYKENIQITDLDANSSTGDIKNKSISGAVDITSGQVRKKDNPSEDFISENSFKLRKPVRQIIKGTISK